jgi:hypothetical protein
MSHPIWGSRPDFCYCQTVADLSTWGALSDERAGLSLGSKSVAQSVVTSPNRYGYLLVVFTVLRVGSRV